MADSEIVLVGPGEIPLVTNLYNEIFRPPQDKAFFERRLLGRYNTLHLVANIERQPVGFALGFELKPSVFFGWLLGVLPNQRRQGVASQLLEAMTTWAAEREYHGLRMECHNAHRAILHLAIESGFNIVGVRWDPDRQDNLVLLERDLTAILDD